MATQDPNSEDPKPQLRKNYRTITAELRSHIAWLLGLVMGTAILVVFAFKIQEAGGNALVSWICSAVLASLIIFRLAAVRRTSKHRSMIQGLLREEQ